MRREAASIIADEKKTGNVCKLMNKLTDCLIRLKESRPVNQGRNTRARPTSLWQPAISLIVLIMKIVLEKNRLTCRSQVHCHNTKYQKTQVFRWIQNGRWGQPLTCNLSPWLGWLDSNQRVRESKSRAFPLGDTPICFFAEGRHRPSDT